MSGFNGKVNVKTFEDAPAHNKDSVIDWVNNLFSNNLEDGFYNKRDNRLERFEELTDIVRKAHGDEFVMKLSKYARNELGQRTASQVAAGILNDSKSDCKRSFYRSFCHRPDDPAEIFSYLSSKNNKPSHAMVRGFGDYISSLDEYSIGKYKMTGKMWNMFDLINVTHAHSAAIDAYKAGTLEAPDTWEVNISGAEDKSERDSEWKRMVDEHKLGYMALLMNLRNILACENIDERWVRLVLCPQITNENAIRKSLVYPYRIYSAYKNCGSKLPCLIEALDTAMRLSCINMKPIPGKTAVVIDVSGSMQSPYSKMGTLTIAEISACYAATVYIANPKSDMYKFGSYAKSCNYNRMTSMFDMIEKICANDGCGYGTYIDSVRECMGKEKYDNVIIFSDMQVMNDRRTGADMFDNANVYSFDLGNYPAVPDSLGYNVHMFTALSPQVFDFIGMVSEGVDIAQYISTNYSAA